MICKLALEDGMVFSGSSVGATGTRTGEVVFNTAMTGYQEVFTDPSYCGQIVVMTFPLIGNYGVNEDDFESETPHLSGVVMRDVPVRPSNFRSKGTASDFLVARGIIGLSGIDTRAVVRRIRDHGALRGVLSTEIKNDLELVRRAAESQPMTGTNFVQRVTSGEPRSWSQGSGKEQSLAGHERKEPELSRCHVLALDCGIKHHILRQLVDAGCRVTVAPAGTPVSRIREFQPDGLLVGNGPGDPSAMSETVHALGELLGEFPIFGICLGHQLLALALGAKTYKLRFGHHGANVPVLNKLANRVEITSQNHGFAVDVSSLEQAGGTVTHVNLNDGSLEGFVHRHKRIMAVQFHPEASPGPHDAGYLIQQFVAGIPTAGAIAAR